MDARIVEEILRSEVGSALYGTSAASGGDRDEMGVCVEHPRHVTGLGRFDQYEHRTQPAGVRSGPGDLDLVVYGLRKYLRLAVQGNPSILLLLFAPDDRLMTCNDLGHELRALAPSIVSKEAGPRFRGYMRAQALRMLGMKGLGHGRRGGGQREELIAEHGYDTKFAMHMVRLGFQGVEVLSTGRITVPMVGEDGEVCRAIRRGEVTADFALERAFALDADLARLMESGPIPEHPDLPAVESWMHSAYLRAWGRACSPAS